MPAGPSLDTPAGSNSKTSSKGSWLNRIISAIKSGVKAVKGYNTGLVKGTGEMWKAYK